MHSTNSGTSWTKIGSFSSTEVVGFGAPQTTGGKLTVYAVGTVSSVYGIYASQDYGSTWTMINSASHQWGWLGQKIVGDPKQFGRVYVATNGRGIVLGTV